MIRPPWTDAAIRCAHASRHRDAVWLPWRRRRMLVRFVRVPGPGVSCDGKPYAILPSSLRELHVRRMASSHISFVARICTRGKTAMSDIERSGSRSASPRRPRTADGGQRDSRSHSRSHSRSRKSRERKDSLRDVKYSRSRSRSASRGRKSYRGSKYTSVSHRGSRSRTRSPYRGGRYSRSRSRSYSRSRYSRDRHVYRSHSRSPMSSRRRHIGNRDNPCPSRCLGVFGLSIFTTEQQIQQIFSKYGPVERVQVVIDAKTGRSRGFCFVYFGSSEDAKVAKQQCTGMEIDGRRIRVDFSITQRAHTPTPGIYMGKPTHLHDRSWDAPRRREVSYRGSYRRSPSPYYSRRRSRYDRSKSRSYSPRRY